MNPMATSKADILKTSRELIQQNGWAAVNIRAVAAACRVSVGCIYNYFGSKTELVSAAVESIWNDIFHHPEDKTVFQDTLSCIRWMYRQMEYGCQQYPGFFTHHALGFVQQDTADGKQQMRQKSYSSTLTEVPGVGPKTAKALLTQFKSVGAVKEATPDQLENTPGVGRQLAQTIYEYFHQE